MIIAQFQVSELAEFLKYGISGLSAIAFILSFFLLSRESSRTKPRPEMLRSIRMFMILALVLGVVSGIAAIMNPTDVAPKPNRKPIKSSNLAYTQKKAVPPKVWKVEIFYDAGAQPLAEELARKLGKYQEYDAKITLLGATKKKELKIKSSQIRYEVIEKEAANQIQKRLSEALPQDVTLTLKQITSSSPDYLSIFVCD
ncbi:hypothetical protein [Runella zeae]|uniref:hypothetical protein n=1 Tax=Runella zeae TaxID=94255 RepID=UPI002352B2A9|nr:hypothetical protein [Runella zeae]